MAIGAVNQAIKYEEAIENVANRRRKQTQTIS